MKTPFLHLTFAAILSMALPLFAQIDGPPTAIDYQGRVLDAVGDPVAQGTTANIEMYFRIWNHISDAQGADLVWAEKQIVTVADGNFSVRLGEGDQIQVSAGDNVIDPGIDDPHNALLDAFDGKDRFLGVSVAPNSVTKPLAEIQPRLAFLTAPFSAVAEKARFAEFGPTSGIFSADQVSIGATAPGSLLEVDGLNELSPTSGGGLISSGPINGSHIAFDADDIQSYSDGSTPSVLNLNTHGGDVSIGSIGATTTVEGLFSVFGGGNGGQFEVFDLPPVGDQQLIAGLDAGFGVNGAQMRFDGDALPIDIGQNASGSFVVESNNNIPRFVVEQGGHVGIGNTNPTEGLQMGTNLNIRLVGGGLRMAHDSFDGIRWINSGGTIYGRIMRGSDNRIYVWNGTGGLLQGVYLQAGNQFWSASSDERLKSDLEPVTGILDKIEHVRVAGYNMAGMRSDPETGKISVEFDRPPRRMNSGKVIKHEIGTIAQDWVEHFPEIVTEPQSKDDHYGISYERIGIIAIGAVQELNHKLKATEANIKERDTKIADLEARLARLEKLLARSGARSAAK